MKWRKFNRIIHRDLGYFFFGMCLIYGLSGIALNHIKDWNPNYFVETKEGQSNFNTLETVSKLDVIGLLNELDKDLEYKKHILKGDATLKVFVKGGSVLIDLTTGKAYLEKVSRRPLFFQFNYLHYNHAKRLWKWFSDLFALGLIFLAISGLFMNKGKNGFTRRGVWFAVVGIIIPLILFLMYT